MLMLKVYFMTVYEKKVGVLVTSVGASVFYGGCSGVTIDVGFEIAQ